MQEYIAMWKNYANFNGRTNLRGYWMAFLINFLIGFVIGFVTARIPSLAFIGTLYSLGALIPGLALSVRRLNDAGHTWKSIFLCFIPLVGVFIFIYRLCKRSVDTAVI